MNLCPAGEAMREKRCFAFPYYCRGSPENCSPPGAAGRMALPSFSMQGLGCADILPLAQKYGGEKNSCLSHTAIRGRQRIASTAGGFIDKIFGWVYNLSLIHI